MMGTIRTESGHAAMQGCGPLFVFALASALFFLAIAPNGFSYEYYSMYGNNSLEGEVANVSVEPANPKVLDTVVATISLRNLQDRQNDFVLRTFVSKDGQVLEENEFGLDLAANRGMSMTLEFLPTKIGTYTVVAKLFNKDKTVLYSEKILGVEVVSDIGPFDLQLDVLSRTIRPGYEIPLLLTMKNMGISGTEVKVAISMDCASQGRIYKDFSVFLKGSGSLDKSLSIPACSEEGYHEISAKIIMFDGVVAQSTSSVFINNTQHDIYVRAPALIEIRSGSSKVFDIYVRNDDAKPMSNVRVIINGIPQEWVSATPEVVMNVAPNESALFIVNVSAPSDSVSAEYPFFMSIGGDEVLAQKEATLKVLEVGGTAQAADVPQPAYDIGALLPGFTMALAAIAVVAFAVWIFKRLRYSNSKIILTKVKDTIRTNE